MNVFFMGTPEFAVPTLDILNENYNVIGVFTQPPRPSGRGMKEIKSLIPVSYTHLRAHET